MQDLMKTNLELQAQKLEMDYKERERNLQKQIEFQKEQAEAKNQQLVDLQVKLNEYEKN